MEPTAKLLPPRTDAERTRDVLDAMQAVGLFTTQHDLHLSVLHINPEQGRVWDEDAKDWVLAPKVCITVAPPRAREFVRWCEALEIDTVRVERREYDTCLHAYQRAHGYTWVLSDAINETNDGSSRLPASAGIEWDRTPSGRTSNHGKASLSGLVAGLDAIKAELDAIAAELAEVDA